MEKKIENKIRMKEKIIKLIKCPIIYVILICLLFEMKLYRIVPQYSFSADSYSYSSMYRGDLSQGKVDALRTPVYPYFIKLIKKIGGEDNLYPNVVKVQKIFFVFALIMLFISMKKITKSNTISSVVTLIVGICPYLIFYNTLILTESLAIFEMIFLIFETVMYIESNSKKAKYVHGIIIAIIQLFMVMTRPAFLYVIPAYICFWVIRFFIHRNEWKNILVGLIALIITSAILLTYCKLMKKQYGIFGFSDVTFINDIVMIIDSNVYQEGDNEDIKNLIYSVRGDTGGANSWKAAETVQQQYSREELNEFIKSAKMSSAFLKFLAKKSIDIGQYTIGTTGYTQVKEEYSFFNSTNMANLLIPINFAFVYFMVGIALVYLVYDLFKNAKIDWYIAMPTVLIFLNLITLIIGAPSEPQRLFAASVVLVIMLIGYMFSKFNKLNEKEIIDSENNLFYKLFLEETENGNLQFLRYIFVGGVAAIVNIGALYVLKEIFDIYYLVANIISFVLGLLTNYMLSKTYVFAKEHSINKTIEFINYTLIGVIGLGLDTLFIWTMTDVIGVYYIVSKIISTCVVFVWNFLGRKMLYYLYKKVNKC